jgi:hypothetical protein
VCVCVYVYMCVGYFEIGSPFCLGWPQTSILLISSSQVSRITGVNHWSPAVLDIFLGVELLVLRLGISLAFLILPK